MREIKFRIWDNELKWWWCEDSQYLQMDGKKIHPAPWSTLSADLPNDSIVVLQYTGLKDKNGVEIYEGDIIHYKFDGDSYPKEAVDRILTCSYDEDEGMYSFDNSDHSYYWAEIKRHCNIIGNLFENPELLE
jgi:uncharacterized phage protein (TIGR01671 family)